jgi:hypothetical protein
MILRQSKLKIQLSPIRNRTVLVYKRITAIMILKASHARIVKNDHQ